MKAVIGHFSDDTGACQKCSRLLGLGQTSQDILWHFCFLGPVTTPSTCLLFCNMVVFWYQPGSSYQPESPLAPYLPAQAVCKGGGTKLLPFRQDPRQDLFTMTSLQFVALVKLSHLWRLLVRIINYPVFFFFFNFHDQLQA